MPSMAPPPGTRSGLCDEPRMLVDDFVRARGGHCAVSKLLICNNGLAAVKCIRSIRMWAYMTFGDERA